MPVLERLIAILAPHYCVACGVEGPLLCAWCTPDVRDPLPTRCYRCHKSTADSATCPSCRRNSPLKHVWVATTYEEGAKELVHKLKFEHAMAAAKPITELMAEALPYLPEGIVIVHVPTATSRRRQRGYDQAELLARHLARRLRRRCMTLLARRGQSRQVGARRMQRTTQLVDAFHPIRPSLIQGAHILLVDDIVTTGASLEAAARVLKQAGAKRIDAVVFAQKI